MKYLDQSGFSLMLSLCYTWFAKGSGQHFKVPTRWRSAGRLNLIGSLCLFGTTEQLEVRELTGSCPAYTPQLNPIESVWRKLKGFLMPRRCYNTLNELKAALNLGLKVLNTVYV